VIILEKLTIQF